jgi:uncharacterized protein
MACRKGCHHCCRRIDTLLPVETAYLGTTASRQGDHGLESELHPGEPLCGLLALDGSCGAYSLRPLICRTHGHLLLTREGIDHCPWNFQDLQEIDESALFNLENLHETLLRINLAFLRRAFPDRWRELAHVRVRFQA